MIETTREGFSRGWRTIKLYFMIGHPSETLEDVQAIADLEKAVLHERRKLHGKAAQVNIGASTFIPKPHTPFQWVPLDEAENTLAKQQLLRRELRGPGLKVSWSRPEESLLEAFLSRGDRRLGVVIFRAWQLGARFDAWQEHHKPEAWREAFDEHGLDPNWNARRPRPIDEVFPWDHIDIGVTKKFLRPIDSCSQLACSLPQCLPAPWVLRPRPTSPSQSAPGTPARRWSIPAWAGRCISIPTSLRTTAPNWSHPIPWRIGQGCR